jgi:uncharacterized protein YjbJ (UPF0337 family)
MHALFDSTRLTHLRSGWVPYSISGAKEWNFGSSRSVSPPINRIEGTWKEAKGKINHKWGHHDQLQGKIQQRYGLGERCARKDVDEWLNSQP